MEFVNFSFRAARQLGSKQTAQFFFDLPKILNVFYSYVTYYYYYIPLMKTIFLFIFWCSYHNTKYKEYYLVPTWCWRWDGYGHPIIRIIRFKQGGAHIVLFWLKENWSLLSISWIFMNMLRSEDPLLSDLISSFSERSVTRIRVFW